jgi:hypothetical protein
MRGRRPWSLASVLRAALTHVRFRERTPNRGEQRHVPALRGVLTLSLMDALRLSRGETISRCSTQISRLAAAELPLSGRAAPA